MLKINRTIISDTSDDGNSFFFHSTSFHNLDGTDGDEDEDYPEYPDPVVGDGKVVEGTDDEDEEDGSTNDIPFLQEFMPNESENEIANEGIDDGLMTKEIIEWKFKSSQTIIRAFHANLQYNPQMYFW